MQSSLAKDILFDIFIFRLVVFFVYLLACSVSAVVVVVVGFTVLLLIFRIERHATVCILSKCAMCAHTVYRCSH